jgi:dTDP-4-amino-4,6-dideoxygalactose transaminase
MSGPEINADDIAAVNHVLETTILSIGPQIDAFERASAAYVGAKYGIGINSGTAGLHMAVIAAGVDTNDMVITSPFSFVASSNAILYERGLPIFVDVDPRTGNLDPNLVVEAAHDFMNGNGKIDRWLPPAFKNLKSKIKNLKSIMPVHAFGQPADMDPIMGVAKQYNLDVIEDACEAIGAEYKGRKAGTIGRTGVFAYYPNKQMTTGEGGMLVTSDADWDALFRSLRNQGRDVFDAWLNHTRLGYNYRLDEMSSALGLSQVKRIDQLLHQRGQVAEWYNQRLTNEELIEPPQVVPTTTRMSWFVYVVRIKAPARREDVMRRLTEVGIPSRPYFTPIHLQPFYRERFGYQRGDFPITEQLGDISLAIPFSGVMPEDQVDYVCEHLRRCVTESASVKS